MLEIQFESFSIRMQFGYTIQLIQYRLSIPPLVRPAQLGQLTILHYNS